MTFAVPLFVLLPMGAALVMPLLGRLWQGLCDILAALVGVALLGLSVWGFVLLNRSPMIVYRLGGWPPPVGIVMSFDSLSCFMVACVALLALAASVYAVRYLDTYTGRWKFYALFMLIIAGVNGVAVTGDIFNLFVFVEISAVSSYALVAFGTRDEDLEAGFKYMVLSEVGAAFLLLALALIYARASTLNFADLARIIGSGSHDFFFWFVLGLLMIAFLVKAAVVPFHAWLPDAHPAAPAPVSAILSGVYIKVLGIYALARVVFNVFGLARASAPGFFDLLVVLGLVSAATGGFLALVQRDYKRLLGYSSVSQVGFILVGLGIGNGWGIAGALLGILAHATGKGLLFLTAGAVERALGTRDLTRMGGLEDRMPVTAWSFITGAASLAGLPPLVGFFAKLFLVIGAVSAGLPVAAVLIVLLSVLTLGYLLGVIRQAFFGTAATPAGREAPFAMALPMVVLAALALVFGVSLPWLVRFVIDPAGQALLRGLDYARLVFGG